MGSTSMGTSKKYLLVGAYTWPVMNEAPWDELEEMEVHPDWPRIDEEEALRDVAYEETQQPEGDGDDFSYRPTSEEGGSRPSRTGER